MPLQPVMMLGRLRLVSVPTTGDAQDTARAEEENLRRAFILRKRNYYEGAQYDNENLDLMASLNLDPLTERLPEEHRLHAYATQIKDSVDFIAGELAEAFAVVARSSTVQTLLDDTLRASDQFSGENEDDEINVETILGEALIAGDVAVEVRWDPIDETAYYECWESEQVEFRYIDRQHVEAVIREEVIWTSNVAGDSVQVLERVVYDVIPVEFPDGSVGVEARKRVFHDEEDEPIATEMLGIPFIPWCLLRGWRTGMRATRGTSIISDQACSHADRYNANEQVAWLTARYNSHGNLAVVGDAASLQLATEGGIHKDVADVLTFPGGTGVESITLPTDPQMIDHQRSVLAESIYQCFGLTRIEPETINGFGEVSGYALEILNRKTEGTFRRIRRSFASDIKSLFAMTIAMVAFRQAVTVDEEGVATGAWWTVNPDDVFPDRRIEIRLGTGYIVDNAMTREDFVAKLISRNEALRGRGYDEASIARIETEIEEETVAATPPQLQGFLSNGAGSTVGQASE